MAKYISALCVYDGYWVYYSEENITAFSNDTNVAQSISNSWASCSVLMLFNTVYVRNATRVSSGHTQRWYLCFMTIMMLATIRTHVLLCVRLSAYCKMQNAEFVQSHTDVTLSTVMKLMNLVSVPLLPCYKLNVVNWTLFVFMFHPIAVPSVCPSVCCSYGCHYHVISDTGNIAIKWSIQIFFKSTKLYDAKLKSCTPCTVLSKTTRPVKNQPAVHKIWPGPAPKSPYIYDILEIQRATCCQEMVSLTEHKIAGTI